MGNGEWGLSNEEWGIGNGRNGDWGMGNGRSGDWGMGNGDWEIGNENRNGELKSEENVVSVLSESASCDFLVMDASRDRSDQHGR